MSRPPLLAREAVDLLRDEALVVDAPRALDLCLPRSSARLGEEPPPRRGELRVAERRSRPRRGEIELRRARPLAEQRLRSLDRQRDPRHDGVAVLGVADRELEHVDEPPRPELLEQQQPAAERAGDAGCEQARARHERVPERRGSARSSPRRARRPGRRGRAARHGRPTRRPRAGRRPARSGAARRPAGRTPPRRRRRRRCRRARAPPSRRRTPASGSTRRRRRCRAAPGGS